MGDEQEWCYAKYGEINPKSGARVLRPMLGEPDGIRGLRATIAEQAERISSLEATVAKAFLRCQAKDDRIADLEAALADILQSTRVRLPFDGIPAKECISTVARLKENLEYARIVSDRQEEHVIAGLGRIVELEEALKRILDVLGIQDLADAMDLDVITQQADGHEVWEAVSKARSVLCHADPVPGCETSSAAPPQSDDGEAR